MLPRLQEIKACLQCISKKLLTYDFISELRTPKDVLINRYKSTSFPSLSRHHWHFCVFGYTKHFGKKHPSHYQLILAPNHLRKIFEIITNVLLCTKQNCWKKKGFKSQLESRTIFCMFLYVNFYVKFIACQKGSTKLPIKNNGLLSKTKRKGSLTFSGWCSLKGHTYLNKPAILSCRFKYI